MWKYAGELSVGDVWTERPQNREPHSYRVIAIAPGLARITMRVTATSVTTGKRRTLDFFLVTKFLRSRRSALPGLPADRPCTRSLCTLRMAWSVNAAGSTYQRPVAVCVARSRRARA